MKSRDIIDEITEQVRAIVEAGVAIKAHSMELTIKAEAGDLPTYDVYFDGFIYTKDKPN